MRLRGIGSRAAVTLVLLLGASAAPAQAQWGYPGGYGGFGWGGWGGGGGTVFGSYAQGLGSMAAGAGYYNQSTAVANSINADTLMRWNQYVYESYKEAGRNERARMARRQASVTKTQQELETRLRENPTQRDVFQGDALNMALEEISDPRIYIQYLPSSKTLIPGKSIANIPFRYAAAGITVSIHRLTQQPPPKSLMTPDFEADREALKGLRAKVKAQIDAGGNPDQALIDQALTIVNDIEDKIDKKLPRHSPDRVEADRYLKALHGLIAMLSTPALDLLLAGVEKRENVTTAELVRFMATCNLRFGPADTPEQRAIYSSLFPTFRKLLDEAAPALAKAEPPKPTTGKEAGEFFEKMQYEDLQKKAPAPPKPGNPN